MSNPLDPVLVWYTTAKDSIRGTTRVVTLGIARAVTNKHVFHGRSATDNQTALGHAQQELDRLTVLALVATFERALRDREEIHKDMEFWNISSRVIELFGAVDANLRGQAKQIIDYRNWVAHGQTQNQPPPLVLQPDVAHLRLTEFLRQAGIVTP